MVYLEAPLSTSPWLGRVVASHLLHLLQSSHDNGTLAGQYQVLSGAISTLSSNSVLSSLRGSWQGTRQLLQVLYATRDMVASLPTERQERAQQLVYRLFAQLCTQWESAPLRDEATVAAADVLVADALRFVASGELLSRGGGDEGSAGASGEGNGSSAVHWRYQLIATTVLGVAMRAECPSSFSEAAWQWVFQCCLSTVVPLRVVGLKMLNSMTVIARRSKLAVPAAVAAQLKSPDFLASLFHAVTLDHPCVARCGVQGWHGAWLTHAVAMQGSLPPRGRTSRRAWTVEHGHPGSHEPAQVRAGCVVSLACCLLSVVFAAAPTAPWPPSKSSRPACARDRVTSSDATRSCSPSLSRCVRRAGVRDVLLASWCPAVVARVAFVAHASVLRPTATWHRCGHAFGAHIGSRRR